MKKVKALPKDERNARLLEHCKVAVSVADMLRKSGAPTESLWLLRGIYPNLLRLVHLRWASPGNTNHNPQSMLAHLQTTGRIDNETFKRLREASVGLGEYATGGDCRFLIDACRLLLTLAQSSAFDDSEDEATVEAVTGPPRPSWLRRWSTAALFLVTFGAIGGAS